MRDSLKDEDTCCQKEKTERADFKMSMKIFKTNNFKLISTISNQLKSLITNLLRLSMNPNVR